MYLDLSSLLGLKTGLAQLAAISKPSGMELPKGLRLRSAMRICDSLILVECFHVIPRVYVKLQIAWKISLASFVLMYCLPSLGQGSTSKDRELYPFAYATVVCYVNKGQISPSSWQEAINRISSQWGMSLSFVTVTDIEMAKLFSARIAPYFGKDCDPNKIPARHVRSALARAIDDGRKLLSSLERRNEAAKKENTCLQAELDRDKAAAGKPYAERIGIEAAYSYVYTGQCIFAPMRPSF